MSDSNQPRRFCTHCGAQLRSGNAFCPSCGKSLYSSLGTRDNPRLLRRESTLEKPNLRPIAIGLGIVALLLLLFWLLRYSLVLGVFILAIGVAGLLMWRRKKGRQSELEERLYEAFQVYVTNIKGAYRAGKHREAAQKVQGFGKNLYEDSRTKYQVWSQSRTESEAENDTLATDDFKLGRQVAIIAAVATVIIVVLVVILGGVATDSTEMSAAEEMNAEAIHGMVDAGTMNMAVSIEEVRVSGNQATVIASNTSSSEAESLCYYTLEAADEFYSLGGMEPTENGDGQITEVSVKRQGAILGDASC